MTSRLGVAAPAIDVSDGRDLYALALDHWPIHYLVCDEAQFYTPEQCDQLGRVVDDLEVEVYAFGLITDFRGRLFDGTPRLLELADERDPLQVEARCWCGSRATHNARVVNGDVVFEGETVVVGDTDDPTTPPLFGDIVRYELLCRRHFRARRPRGLTAVALDRSVPRPVGQRVGSLLPTGLGACLKPSSSPPLAARSGGPTRARSSTCDPTTWPPRS